MTEQDLRESLSQYGTVISVRILRDQHKTSRGVGFARMNDREQCQAIINRFDNQCFPGELREISFWKNYLNTFCFRIRG